MTPELRVFGSSQVNGFRKSQGARSILWRNCRMRDAGFDRSEWWRGYK